jgi:exopolysaccharide biosynthesis protein
LQGDFTSFFSIAILFLVVQSVQHTTPKPKRNSLFFALELENTHQLVRKSSTEAGALAHPNTSNNYPHIPTADTLKHDVIHILHHST